MSQRLDYASLAKPMYQQLYALTRAVKSGSLETSLLHLLDLRASLLNGCAFCVDMHTKEAIIAGEKEIRLFHVAVWRESPLFSKRERAMFAWVETVTQLPPHGVSQAEYDAIREQFSEQEVAELVFAIAGINAWNRLAISFAAVPGSMDHTLGLDKAGLSLAAQASKLAACN